MSVLVVGASGFIGCRVLSSLRAVRPVQGTFCSNSARWVRDLGLEQLDVRNASAVVSLIHRLDPRVVVLVCGTKDIALCERHPEEARAVHVEGTANVANACRERGARLVYVSTDCVFNGREPLYSESDATDPFNEYGRAKRAAELLVESSQMDSIIIRVSFLFGWRRPGQASNFVCDVYDALSARRPFKAASNLFNTPLHIASAAEAIAQLALSERQGIFHVAGRDRISRLGVAECAAETFGLQRSRLQSVVDSSGLRQPNSCLACDKAADALGSSFEGVRQGLSRMAAELREARAGGL